MVLELGKMEIYPCQLLDNLVRIGNISRDNPNHFWNALFFAFKSYRDMTYKERMSYIKDQRKKIASSIDLKEWLVYGNGFQSNHQIFEEFRKQFTEADPSSSKAIELILRIVKDRQVFLEKLNMSDYHVDMKDVVRKEMTKSFERRLNDTEKDEGKTIPSEKREKCVALFQTYVTKLWTRATDTVFQRFVEDLQDSEWTLPFYLVPLVLSYVDFHVFFVDVRGQDVLSINDHYEKVLQTPKEQCILVLYDIKTQGYESLSVMDPNEDDEDQKTVCLTRVFELDDPIAQICYKRIVESH